LVIVVWDILVMVSSDVTPYCLVDGTNIWQETTACILRIEDRRTFEVVSGHWTGTHSWS